MSAHIESQFGLGDTVMIGGLACQGRVVGLYVDEAATIWVRVRFTINTGEPKEEYMLAKDLNLLPDAAEQRASLEGL